MFAATAHVCGYFTLALAVLMMAPMLTELSAGSQDWHVFLVSALLVGLPSALLVVSTARRLPPFTLRFGFLVVNAVWASASLVSALPLMLSPNGISFTDAVFEATSGITTTGSTVLSGLDNLPPGILLWRSMMQWFGGLGIIAMGFLLLPFLRVGGMQIYKMESSVQSDNPYTRFSEFSVALTSLYVTMTAACALAYLLAGMSPFAAINHAMTTVSTGGYSIHDASMGHYGNGVLAVSVVFMVGGALPFIALLKAAVTGDPRRALEIQIPVLLAMLAGLSILVALAAASHTGGAPIDIIVGAAFNVVSVVTTTGYASTDYTRWGPFAVTLFLAAMFLGGAAGSTSGGIKTYRLIILYQAVRNGLKELVYPRGLFIVRYDGREMPLEAIRSVALFLAAMLGLLLTLTAMLGSTGLDLVTAFTGALTALTNVGPGLGDVIGPAGNFSTFEPLAKWVMIFGMLAGRLEILTVLVVFSPTFWRR
jgi:trk system potassium uptake protein